MEAIPSLFRGIFSERNSVANPIRVWLNQEPASSLFEIISDVAKPPWWAVLEKSDFLHYDTVHSLIYANLTDSTLSTISDEFIKIKKFPFLFFANILVNVAIWIEKNKVKIFQWLMFFFRPSIHKTCKTCWMWMCVMSRIVVCDFLRIRLDPFWRSWLRCSGKHGAIILHFSH